MAIVDNFTTVSSATIARMQSC